MEATYISGNSFSVTGARTDEFLANRRLKLDCGIDGIKYASVVSSAFTSVTTVIIDESVLTANLAEVFYSILKPGEQGNISDHFHTNTEGDGGYIAEPVTSFTGLIDTPSTYSGTVGFYTRSTGSGIDFVDASEEFVPWNFGSGTISGTGDIYCNDIYTSSGTVYIGELKLSSADGQNLLINDEEMSSSAVESFLDLNDTPIEYPLGDEYIGLTIDHTKVTNPLTNFPTVLNISEDSGIGSEDLTDFFTELHIHPDDSFFGTDGDDPNPNLWTTSGSTGTTAVINTDKLRLTIPVDAADQSSRATGQFIISGDFDVQVDYNEVFLDRPSSSQSYMVQFSMVHVSDSAACLIGVTSSSSSSSQVVTASPAFGSPWTTGSPYYATGKVRFTRVGTVTKAYHWSGTQWVWNGSTNGYTFTGNTRTEDVKFTIGSTADFNGGSTYDFSNFTINAGTLIWPNGYPYRKKIQIKDSSGNQCYTEIENWDQENKKVVLHTKVPYISDATDTNLSLIYDSTMEDNDGFIGDTGEWIEGGFTGDDFTGTDGDLPDIYTWITNYPMWSTYPEHDNSTTTIQNNKLEIDIPSTANTRGSVFSKFKISADLSVEVDWEGDEEQSIYIWKDRFSTDDRAYIGITDTLIRCDSNIAGAWEGITSVSRTNTYGKFRVSRSGTTLTFMYQDGTQSWQTLGTKTFISDDMFTYLHVRSISTIQTFTFDNFSVVSGTVYTPGPSQKVWEDGYKTVYHMAQDPSGGENSLLDSTSNRVNATPDSTMTSSDLIDGAIGKALEFDGVDDWIEINDTIPFIDKSFTWEVSANLNPLSTDQWTPLVGNFSSTGANQLGLTVDDDADSGGELTFNDWGGAINCELNPPTIDDAVWHVISMSIDDASDDGGLYLDGVNKSSSTDPVLSSQSITTRIDTDGNLNIGMDYDDTLVESDFIDGKISEIRVSNIVRSDTWIKATNESLTDNLITYEFNYPSKYLSVNSTADGLIFKDFDSVTNNTFIGLDDTPSTYSGTEDMYLQSTGDGTVWVTISGTNTEDFVTWDFGAQTISGSGDIYCNDIYTANGTVYIGDLKLSADGNQLVVDELPMLRILTGTAAPTSSGELDDYYLDTTEGILYKKNRIIDVVQGEVKSIIFDVTNNHGDAQTVGIRSVEFYKDDSLLTFDNSDFTTYNTTNNGEQFQSADFAFDTSLSKVGGQTYTSYLSGHGQTGSQRVTCVFNEIQFFDTVVVNNFHSDGNYTDRGARDTKVYIHSTDAITSTVYNEAIPGSSLVFDEAFTQHVATNTIQDETIVSVIDPDTGWDIVLQGVETFLDLTDTPSTYSGTEDMYLQSTGSGTVWSTVAGVESFLDLNDTPTTYSGGEYLRTTTSGIEAIDGVIITAPDTSEWLIQVTNSGTLYTTSI